MGKRKRKILIGFGIVLLALVVIVAALPVWFPWVLRPILQRYGVRYSACERIGYGRFALKRVTFVQANTKIEAERLEAPVPSVWLWRLYVGNRKAAGEWVRVSDWRLTVSTQTNRAFASRVAAPYPTFLDASADVLVVRRWVPSAAFTNGSIVVDRRTILVPSASWNDGKLAARVAESVSRVSGVISADARTNLSWQVSMRVDSLDLGSQFLVTTNAANVQLTGGVLWRSNRIDVSAQLGGQEWIPARASVTSKGFHVLAASLRFPGYDELGGSLDAQWANGQFVVDLNAEARPQTNSGYPPLQAVFHATGDTQAVTIETASISVPGLNARLSGGTKVDFKGRLLSPETVVQISADLSSQHWVALTGSVDGVARLRPGPTLFPEASFTLSATNLISHAVQAEAVTLSGDISGAWSNVSYSLHVDIGQLNVPGLAPLKAQADLRGQGSSLDHLNGQFTAGDSSVLIAGSGSLSNQVRLQIQTLDFNRSGKREFKLAEPFAASCAPANTGSNAGPWIIDIAALHWTGNGRDVAIHGRVSWPSTGSVTVSVNQTDLKLFQDFVPKPVPQIRIGEFKYSGTWTKGPVRFETDLSASVLEVTNAPFLIQLQAFGDTQGVSVRRLVVSTEKEAVVSGQGALPFTIEPGGASNIFNLQAEAPLSFSASTRPNAAFWNEVASLVGVRFVDPRLDINVSGTARAPQGKLALAIKRIDILKPSFRLVRLEGLTADLTVDQRHATLDQFRVLVQGQPVTATAEFPVAARFARDLKALVDLDRSTGKISATNLQIAAIAPLIPDVLAPRGSVTMALLIHPGRQLDGSLILADAATQPLGTMGAFLDVNAQFKLAGRSVVIQNCSGFLGGGRLSASGGMELGMPSRGQLPRFDFKLIGSNVPLVRQPDVIVRSDVDIVVSNSVNAEPVVSGNLILGNSFYLKDLADLIPGEVSTPEQRPPYFSVPARPFSDWHLDLNVKGTNFMKVDTPYFTGGVSANFKVHGTLREPVAVGEARIVSGTILFPFSNMEVRQGLISLFSDNPFQPQIFVTAASKTFGYDVRLEITGPATRPKLEFFSTPPLTSEQALLMVTAGVLPEGEASFSTQQRAQHLALFLGKSFLNKLGLSGGADRLTIRSGEYLTESGGQTYSLEYRLTNKLSIVGEYNRFAEVVFSLRWKVYSK